MIIYVTDLLLALASLMIQYTAAYLALIFKLTQNLFLKKFLMLQMKSEIENDIIHEQFINFSIDV